MAEPALSRLACLGGELAPPDLARDLARLVDLPEPAKAAFWQVLGPSLGEHLDERTEALLTSFCKERGVADDALARPLKAARHLYREAAKRAVPRDAFERDVRALVGDEQAGAIIAILSLRHDEAMRALRLEIVRAAVVAHGSLLVGFDWRVDKIVTSPRGKEIGASVAMLTLAYQSGGKIERLTVQALPDVLQSMRAALDEMLGKAT